MSDFRAQDDLYQRLTSQLRLSQQNWLLPACVAGAVGTAAVLWWMKGRKGSRAAGMDFVRKLLNSVDLDPTRHELLALIRDSLIGHRRRDVQSVLGSPQAAADGAAIYSKPSQSRREAASRWYYRLDRLESTPQRRGAALVIDFEENDKVRDARFLVPPEAR